MFAKPKDFPKDFIKCTTVSCRPKSIAKSVEKNGLISNAKVILWVSHNNPHYEDIRNIQALADLFYKIFTSDTVLEVVPTGK